MCSVLEDSKLIRRELFRVLLLPQFKWCQSMHLEQLTLLLYRMPLIKDECIQKKNR